MTEFRAHFDARVSFLNGGGLTAEGFRLDLPERDVTPERVGQLLVQHLGLALVGEVVLDNLVIVEEQHRGSRGIETAPRSESRRFVELSHPIRDGLVSYPGLPAPSIAPHMTHEQSRGRYAEGTVFGMQTITMLGNTGTYLDSPFHRYPDGPDLAGLPLETLAGLRAEVVHVQDATTRGVPASAFFDRDVRGAAVLIHTGWSAHFGTPAYGSSAPYLTGEAAAWLRDNGAVLVGIDSLNIDDTESGGERPAHTLLLEAGIHIVEHLTALDRLPAMGAEFTATPPLIEGIGTFPVRAFATIGG